MLRFPRILRRTLSNYELLSTDSESRASPLKPSRLPRRHFLRRFLHFRCFCISATAVVIVFVCAVLVSGIPSLYGDVRRFEHILPQHSAVVARHSNVKYISFPNHIWGHGWNNVLQQ